MKWGNDDLLGSLGYDPLTELLLLKKLRTVGSSFSEDLLGDSSADGTSAIEADGSWPETLSFCSIDILDIILK